jgi:hypothetical protein
MRTFIFLIMIFPLNLMAQLEDSIKVDLEKFTIDKTTGKITFTFIDSIKGINKNLLYGKSLEWIAKNFKDATEVIKLQDKENGKIIAKGYLELNYVYQRIYGINYYRNYRQNFTLDLTLRDEKYRLILSDFTIQSFDPPSETTLEYYLPQIQGYDYSKMSKVKKITLFNFKNVVNNSLLSSGVFNTSIKNMLKDQSGSDKW